MQLVDPDVEAGDTADDEAVDALDQAITALVRACRHAGRRTADLDHCARSGLELLPLLGAGEHRLRELAALRGVGQSVISRQIAELEAQGLACRRPDPDDGRASLVRLTDTGHELLTELGSARRRRLREVLAAHSTQDLRDAAQVVATLAEELDRLC